MRDLIDRESAIWHVKANANSLIYQIKALEELPPAQPEQKVGKWIRHKNKDGEYYGYDCSTCGAWFVMPYGKTKFCPNCGEKKMEEQDG